MKFGKQEFTDLTLEQREKIATIASEWWTDKISSNFKHDNGDYSATSLTINFLADLGKDVISDEKKENFKNKLKEKILFHMEGKEYEFTTRLIDLHCDYGPGFILKEVAIECNISEFNFPYKTGMCIESNYIRLFDGYGKRPKYIFATKEFYEQEIKSYENSIKELQEEYDEKRKTYFESKEDILFCIKEKEKVIKEYQEIIQNEKYDKF